MKFLKRLFKKVYAQRTVTEDPIMKFMYRVTIPGLPDGMGFVSCSGLDEEVAVTEYHESGYQYAHKLPGRTSVSEVTLTRGEYLGDSQFKKLVKDSVTQNDIRRTIIIEKMHRHGQVARTYKLAEAWASRWEGSDYDATSDDVAIETLVIQFEHYLE
jgi:phage tail-like protein